MAELMMEEMESSRDESGLQRRADKWKRIPSQRYLYCNGAVAASARVGSQEAASFGLL